MSAAGRFMRKLSGSDGKPTYMVYCPGCKYSHPIDSRWSFDGNLEAPTFNPSLLCNAHDPQQRCHSFIRAGQWQFLSDCHHELKGQTVPMVAINEDWEAAE